MKILEAMIAWDANYDGDVSERVQVGPWPDRSRWTRQYQMADGACDAFWHELDPAALERQLGIVFITMTVRDGVCPKAAHNELLKIDEYRERMVSPDTPGAAGEPLPHPREQPPTRAHGRVEG
jgi:hypothetical protein